MRKPQSDKPDAKANKRAAQAMAADPAANGHSPEDGDLDSELGAPPSDQVEQAPHRQEIGTIEAGPLAANSVSFVKPNKYHAIDDKELDYLMKFEKPTSVLAAGLFGGVFLGTVYQAFTAFSKITGGAASVGFGDVLYIVVCACAFGAAVATAVMALRGKSDVVKALEAVRKRSKLYLPPNHPATPPGSDGV